MKSLLPPGWPRPKGYSNGISATGRMIFTAGVVGWDEREFFPSHRLDSQFGQALRNVLAILREDGAGPEHIVRLTVYVTQLQEYLNSRDELGPIGNRSWAPTIRPWRWWRSSVWSSRPRRLKSRRPR